MELSIGKVNTWVRRRPRYEAPGRRTSRAFLGRLAFRPSPFGALGLGRLARGTEPGPMVPTHRIQFNFQSDLWIRSSSLPYQHQIFFHFYFFIIFSLQTTNLLIQISFDSVGSIFGFGIFNFIGNLMLKKESNLEPPSQRDGLIPIILKF